MGEKLLIDPHSPAYEAARAEMVEVLRQIGREDSLNGYAQMADDLAVGDLMEVPTWIALALMAARAPADLRSALEAETIERCAKVAEAERVDADATRHPEDRAYNVACEHIAEAIRALAPTKGDVS